MGMLGVILTPTSLSFSFMDWEYTQSEEDTETYYSFETSEECQDDIESDESAQSLEAESSNSESSQSSILKQSTSTSTKCKPETASTLFQLDLTSSSGPCKETASTNESETSSISEASNTRSIAEVLPQRLTASYGGSSSFNGCNTPVSGRHSPGTSCKRLRLGSPSSARSNEIILKAEGSFPYTTEGSQPFSMGTTQANHLKSTSSAKGSRGKGLIWLQEQ